MFRFLPVLLTGLVVGMLLSMPGIAVSETRGGVGMTVAQLYDPDNEDHRGHLVVLEVFPGKPAAMHGILPGDIILKIGDKETSATDLNVLLNDHLRGNDATPVVLTLWRTSATSRLEVNMTREMIAY